MSSFDKELLGCLTRAELATQVYSYEEPLAEVLLSFDATEDARRFVDYWNGYKAGLCNPADIASYKVLRAHSLRASALASEARAKLPVCIRRAIDKEDK